MHTTIEPGSVVSWGMIMQYAVTCKTNKAEGYVGIAEECFTMNTPDWRAACLEPTDRGAKRSEFNSYLAEGLHAWLL